MPCRRRIALVFQSLLEICPQISKRTDFADEESKQWSFIFSDTCLTLRRLCENRTRRIDPKLSASGFPDTSLFLEVLTARSLARHNPIEVQFSQ